MHLSRSLRYPDRNERSDIRRRDDRTWQGRKEAEDLGNLSNSIDQVPR